MDRRDFIKVSGLATAGFAIPGLKAEAKVHNQEQAIAKSFTFNSKGKFKILQITDTHYIIGDERSSHVRDNITYWVQTERPDLIIHTGDVVNDGNRARKDGEESMRLVLGWLADFKIPFAVTLGNHDGQYELSRSEMFKVIKDIPYNINEGSKGVYGDSNDVITLSATPGGVPQWVFYLFDSGDTTDIPMREGRQYDYIHFDQIGWYRDWSSHFTAINSGKPIPSIAFQHIPVPEITYALRDRIRLIKGNLGEEPGVPAVNSGLVANIKEMGDIKAMVFGHDHDCDFVTKWKDIFLMHGRFSGGDTVYNDLKPCGARVFEFTKGQTSFRSWIRLIGGDIIQNLRYPEDFDYYG